MAKKRMVSRYEAAFVVVLLAAVAFFAYTDNSASAESIVSSGNAIASGGSLPSGTETWAGVPWDVTNPSDTLVSTSVSGGKVRVAAKGHYIWRTGYIFNAKTRQWTQFTFPQTSQYEGWAQDNAIVNVPLKADEILEGDNYVLAYTCNWKNSRWYCGCLNENICDRWQLQTFTAHGMTDAISEDMAKYLNDPASVPDFENLVSDVVVINKEIAQNVNADFNRDGAIDFSDFFEFADAFGKPVPPLGGIAKFDLSGNGKVDFDDFFIFADNFGMATNTGESIVDVEFKKNMQELPSFAPVWTIWNTYKNEYNKYPTRIETLADYKNKLYAGTSNPEKVLVYDENTWKESIDFDDDDGRKGNAIKSFYVYEDKLFAGIYIPSVSNEVTKGLNYYDGTAWGNISSSIMKLRKKDGQIQFYESGSAKGNPMIDIAGFPRVDDFKSLASYNNKLYLGDYTGSAIYVYDISDMCQYFSSLSTCGDTCRYYLNTEFCANGGRRVILYTGALGGDSIDSMIVYNNKLYAGTHPEGKLHVYDGTKWELSHDFDDVGISSMAVYNGKLYVGTWKNGKVYVYDGTQWLESYAPREKSILSMIVYNNKLYAGTGNNGKIFVYDGIQWLEYYDSDETEILSLAVYNNKLYAGTSPKGKILVSI